MVKIFLMRATSRRKLFQHLVFRLSFLVFVPWLVSAAGIQVAATAQCKVTVELMNTDRAGNGGGRAHNIYDSELNVHLPLIEYNLSSEDQ